MTTKSVYQCQCENCQQFEYHPDQEIHFAHRFLKSIAAGTILANFAYFYTPEGA